MIQTSLIDLSLRKAAATSITGYQKYISPHKGFSCAHRVLSRLRLLHLTKFVVIASAIGPLSLKRLLRTG